MRRALPVKEDMELRLKCAEPAVKAVDVIARNAGVYGHIPTMTKVSTDIYKFITNQREKK